MSAKREPRADRSRRTVKYRRSQKQRHRRISGIEPTVDIMVLGTLDRGAAPPSKPMYVQNRPLLAAWLS